MITNCKENKTDMNAYLAGPRNHHQGVLRSTRLLVVFVYSGKRDVVAKRVVSNLINTNRARMR